MTAMPTKGTYMTTIKLVFGNTEVFAQPNDSQTAKAFAEKLPVTIPVGGTGIDFCGRMPFALPYDEADVHSGWVNGDVNYNPHGGWFAVLYGDEEHSGRYGDQVVMGRIEGSELAKVQSLDGDFDLRIELA